MNFIFGHKPNKRIYTPLRLPNELERMKNAWLALRLSSSYQQRVLIENSKRGAVWKVFDIIMSVVFMGLEILLVLYLTRQL